MNSEIECPVCDRKAPASASTCPNCGADLRMASFDELEEVAQVIAHGGGPASPPMAKSPAVETPAISTQPRERERTVEAPEPDTPLSQRPEPPDEAKPPAVEEQKPPEEEASKDEKKDEEGKRGIGRLFGRKKK